MLRLHLTTQKLNDARLAVIYITLQYLIHELLYIPFTALDVTASLRFP